MVCSKIKGREKKLNFENLYGMHMKSTKNIIQINNYLGYSALMQLNVSHNFPYENSKILFSTMNIIRLLLKKGIHTI